MKTLRDIWTEDNSLSWKYIKENGYFMTTDIPSRNLYLFKMRIEDELPDLENWK